MWLEAHVPGEPLNFLDHKIKNGDAIVGLARMEELYNGIATEAFKAYKDAEKENCRILKASNKKQRKAREVGQLRLQNVKEIVENKLKVYKEKFEAFAVLPENTIEEIEAKKKAHKKLNSGGSYWFAKGLADLQVAQFFVDKSELVNVATDDDYFDIMAGRKTQTKAEVMALAESTKRNFFHWFLEFPEVFAQGGFSVILGNPPFLGGVKISSNYGDDYLNYLLSTFDGSPGRSDLIVYFLRQISNIIKEFGFLSLISTNSISKGLSYQGGLKIILENQKYQVNHVISDIKWPGLANVNVSLVTLHHGLFAYDKYLDGNRVDYISGNFESFRSIGDPFMLNINKQKVFRGSVVVGDGFYLDQTTAQELINKSIKNKEVIRRVINGKQLNNIPNQISNHYIVFFRDFNENVSQEYKSAYNHIYNTVYLKNIDKNFRSNWWNFERPCMGIYRQEKQLDNFIVTAMTSKYLSFSLLSSNQVFTQSLYVMTSSKMSDLSLLSCTFHNEWSWKYSSKMKNDLRYSVGDCFEKYPFPPSISDLLNYKLNSIGDSYVDFRKGIMKSLNLGLTKTYNQFHNQDLRSDSEKDISNLSNAAIKINLFRESWNLYNHLQKTEGTISFTEAAEKIAELRRLHVEMDLAVLEAYGWNQDTKRWGPAIALRHDFYEVDYLPENDRVRYTIHPDARKEVLKRLLLLNHEIHESEERGISYEELDKEKIMEIYQEEIGSWLDQPEVLHPKTLKYLAHAEELYPDLQKKAIKEFSPYVAEICKSLENEILHKLFIPYTKKVKEEWEGTEEEWNSYMKDQKSKKLMSKFAGHIKQQNLKYTLGDMHFHLDLIWKDSSSVLDDSEILRDFKDFAFKTYDTNFINQASLNKLKSIFEIYRNASAHADEKFDKEEGFELYDIDAAKAEECRKAVREMINLMVKSQVN